MRIKKFKDVVQVIQRKQLAKPNNNELTMIDVIIAEFRCEDAEAAARNFIEWKSI